MKKTLYIFQDGELHRKDNSLYFESKNQRKFIPVENTSDIYIFGEVSITKRFLEFARKKEICIHFFNRNGCYIGTFYPRESYNSGHVIVKQIQHFVDKNKRIVLARKFVCGSIKQMIQVLRYYHTRALKRELIKEITEELLNQHDNVNKVQTIKELNLFHKCICERYYHAFDYIIDNQDFAFEKRNKLPAQNRINVLISFGNAMCCTIVLSEIYKTYLDPKIAYLHSPNFSQFTLNLDVAQVFKPFLIDRLIFRLVNRKMLTTKDFTQTTDGFVLSIEGRRKMIQELDRHTRTTVNHRHLGRSVSYRRLIRLELYKLQKHILGEKEYEPYKSFW